MSVEYTNPSDTEHPADTELFREFLTSAEMLALAEWHMSPARDVEIPATGSKLDHAERAACLLRRLG